MYISLYRRYRPQTFSDMVGQSAAVGVLQESLREGTLGHAYLFSGPRGCGKTSAARLVAKSLDCSNRGPDCEPCGTCVSCRAIAAGEHLDVIEIDGASNRGIGEIRDLKSHVSLKALSASYKVYIIDEVHMLTDAAFNALLKTLEEPPANVVFLLATTEPHKVPVTIRSRCQHIPFHRITIADTVSRLKYVCSQEHIEADDEAVWEIARQADGALRDALSLTEQAVALGRGSLSAESVRELTGGSSRSELEKWMTLLRTDPQAAASALQTVMGRGISPERLCESLFVLFRDMWLYSMWQEKALDALETSESEKTWLKAETSGWDKEKLRLACALCNRLLPRTRYGMKGDVFAGAIFMELLDIINGSAEPAPRTAQPVPQRAAVQAPVQPNAGRPREMPAARAAVPAAKPVNTRPAVTDEYENVPQNDDFYDFPPFDAYEPVPRSEPAAPKPPVENRNTAPLAAPASGAAAAADAVPDDKEELTKKLGGTEFAKLLENLQSDRVIIGAALLNAELYRKDGKLDIRFERQMPAKNFLTIPKCRKALILAAAKLWGITSDVPQKEEPQPPESEPKRDAADDRQKTAGAAPAQQPQSDEDSPEDTAALAAAHALRLAGAELLYVENDTAGEEDAEGNEQ